MFTKNFMGGWGGNFHGGKFTPKNASHEHCTPETCPPPPRKKKEKKKRKLTPENIIF